MQIDIDFDVYKALTAKRKNENHSYNDVLRALLGLEPVEQTNAWPLGVDLVKALVSVKAKPLTLRNGELPSGTRLRAVYKGVEHRAIIKNGRWISENDEEFGSPSAAAKAITGTNVNGLRFWNGKRPIDESWQRLDVLLAINP